MFVRGNGRAKCDVSQVLEGVGKGVVLGVSPFPKSVSLSEFLRRKGGESQQIIRPVFDHVDSQGVPWVEGKTWPRGTRRAARPRSAPPGCARHSVRSAPPPQTETPSREPAASNPTPLAFLYRSSSSHT